MPTQPKPVDRGGLIDPKRQGDNRTYTPPKTRDGKPVNEKPYTNSRGRHLPPGRDHGRVINDRGAHDHIRGVHNRWNRNDHGYSWHTWNGHRMSHHYDRYGFHWWGWYINNIYFWTRYHNDRYWWYDPYWRRWCYMHDNRWWWQDPATSYVYAIIDNRYYRYQDNGGTVVVTPDPTQPEETPPADPNEPVPTPGQETIYSVDGTRSIQILGDKKDAYLYDLTVEDSNGAGAGGRWLATGVASVKFVYDEKIEDGATTQVVRQIELTFEDPKLSAVADINGERKIVISGDEKSADLHNLKDAAVEPKWLASGVSNIKLVNSETLDGSGETVRSLKEVLVGTKDADGADTILTFDRDGKSADAAEPAPTPAPEPVTPPTPAESPAQRMQKSSAFKALTSGQLGW